MPNHNAPPKVAAPQSEAALERELEVRLAAQLGCKVDSFGRWWLLPYNMWLPGEIRDALLSAERQRRELRESLSKVIRLERLMSGDSERDEECYKALLDAEAEAEALLEGGK